jgi:hypothetical protein
MQWLIDEDTRHKYSLHRLRLHTCAKRGWCEIYWIFRIEENMSKFKIEISSVPDRENLVAEIWYNEILIAEISQEGESSEIELYKSENIRFDLDGFLETLKYAKKELSK